MTTNIYPTRSFIRFKAKSQLIADLSGHSVVTFVDRADNTTSLSAAAPQDAPSKGEVTDPVCVNFEALDEPLLRDIASTLFHPNRHPELYQPCQTRSLAMSIEAAIATEIVQTYKQIKRNEYNATVQGLNSLL
ncbi:MAG: hypothetical protein ACFB8W_09240 [Elainellaceae cyanobacterium]